MLAPSGFPRFSRTSVTRVAGEDDRIGRAADLIMGVP
jgi:hypothetical protein